jgi:hypothetical protein
MHRERSGESRDVEINVHGGARRSRRGRSCVQRAADHGRGYDGWYGWNNVPHVTRRMDRRGARRWPVDLAHYRPYQAREVTCFSEA